MGNIGPRLEMLRLKMKLSAAQVAQRVGVSSSTYRDWELGRQIKGEPYLKLAKVLNSSLSYIITGNKPHIEQHLIEIEKHVKSIKNNL